MKMGYRSEVAVAIKVNDYEKFMKGNSDIKELLSLADITSNEEIVILHWDWIKWYPEYSDIQKFNNILDIIADNEHPYTFIRIGEDYDDNDYIIFEGEENEYLDEYIYPIRYINIPEDWKHIN